MMLPILGSPNSPRRRGSPGAKRPQLQTFQREESAAEKERQRSSFTAGQAYAFAAFCASVAVVLTASIAFYFFAPFGNDVFASTTRVVSHRRMRSISSMGSFPQLEALMTADLLEKTSPSLLSTDVQQVEEISKFPMSTLPKIVDDSNSPRPHVAWLMSFPNRYV